MSAPGALDSDSNQSLNSLIIQNLLTPTRIGKLLKYLPMFEDYIPLWKKKGLMIKYLIPYAPELNLIEILWRHIKYFWLPFSSYQCMEALREALEQILKDFGSKYQITFA